MVIDEARSEATLRFTVKNITGLSGTSRNVRNVISTSSYVHHLPWCIQVKKTNESQKEAHLGVFLKCDLKGAEMSWSCSMNYSIEILSLIQGSDADAIKSLSNMIGKAEWTPDGYGWGWPKFISWEDLLDPKNGFITDDSITLEVSLFDISLDGMFWDSKKLTGFVGLKSRGSTCYVNSLLQSLYSICELRKAVYEVPAENYDNTKSVVFALQRTFYELQTSDKPVNTKIFIESLDLKSQDYFLQHDIHAFLQMLFENLQSEMKGTSVERTIPKLFKGKMITIIKCKNSCYPLTKEDIYHDIHLNIKGKKDILQSFTDHLKPEILSGNNKYNAGEQGLQDADKTVAFISFPPVLILHLKRFYFDPVADRFIKFNDRFEFSEKLSLDPFLTNSESISANYSLHAVLAHSGKSYGGSRVVYICSKSNGKWYKFDDDIVCECTKKEAVDSNFGGNDDGLKYDPLLTVRNAYMLVYIRDSEEKTVLKTVSEEDIPKELIERLQGETHLEQLRKKGGKGAYSYMTVNIVLEKNFEDHQSFGLYDPERAEYQALRVQKWTTLKNFLDNVSKTLNYPLDQIRLWPLEPGVDNQSYRPAYINMKQDSHKFIADLSLNQNPWNVFLEVATADLGSALLPPYNENEDALLFFKLYDPKLMNIFHCGHYFVPVSTALNDLIPILNDRAGFPPDTKLRIFEEKAVISQLEPILNFEARLEEILDNSHGTNIIVFQREEPTEIEAKYIYKTPNDYFRDSPVEVTFCDNAIPEDAGFKFQLQKKTAYDEIVEKIAQKLGVNRQKIEFLAYHGNEDTPGNSAANQLGRTIKDFLSNPAKKVYYRLLPNAPNGLENRNDGQLDDQSLGEKQPDQIKRKGQIEAYSYMEVNILLEDCFDGHQGPDLFDPKKSQGQIYREKKNTTLLDFLDHVSKTLNCSVKQIRPWSLLRRSNNTCRPAMIDWEQDLLRSISDVSGDQNPWNVFLEVAPPDDTDLPCLPPYNKGEEVLLFFKLYDPKLMKIFYCGHYYLPKDQTMYDLILMLNERAGFPPSTKLLIYEEVKPSLLEPILNLEAPLKEVIEDLMDGDIIIFQKREPPTVEDQYKFKTPGEYYRAFLNSNLKDDQKTSIIEETKAVDDSNGLDQEDDFDRKSFVEGKTLKMNSLAKDFMDVTQALKMELEKKASDSIEEVTEDDLFGKNIVAELKKIDNKKAKRILKAKVFSLFAEFDDDA